MNKRELQQTVQPYTMATPERINLLIELAERCNTENIPGDFVECGVCNGGSAAILAHFAVEQKRDTHLFDSWQGLPAITDKDTPSFGTNHPATVEVGKCVGDKEKVREVMAKVGALGNRTYMHEGWFEETFPKWQDSILTIAMLNLDSDWYESEKLCLETWYDKVVSGGFIYFDDFAYWPGCQQAAYDFFTSRNIKPVFNFVGHSAWIRKGQ